MPNLLVALLLPFGLTLALASLIRLAAGPARGTRLAGGAVIVGFLLSWTIAARYDWSAQEPIGRMGHIALGALLVGLVLDYFQPKRFLAAIAAGVVVLAASWASVNAGLWPPLAMTLPHGALFLGLAIAAFLVLVRLDRLARDGASVLVILAMIALAVAAIALVVHDQLVMTTGLMLALAVLGYFVIAASVQLPVGDAVVLGAGSAVLALAWALSQRNGASMIAMVLIPLILFADGTARRVPLPKARISAFLYPLILAAIAALPVALAVLVAFATTRS